ncbi:1,4-alpha-glucan branching protein GlgB [Catenovulum sp. SM1970]|uniref:1,4-alpha-glucan branching protein GlgB n=1 Tax=Marinifaba aquimaris TaxID=2741323 RepID=UPI0015731F43|nr:1,4-alpha-glucan branching protein GlgB [Marinifaba aquimaris]NTS76977.1 1,4-alpha-glucan branching protein GlgB [Marinifaba aquimaris]
MLVNNLDKANVFNPFSHLGFTQTDKGLMLTAWQPHAQQIDVIDLTTNELVKSLTKIDEKGLFQSYIDASEPFDYKLKIKNAETEYEVVDPYQFEEQAYYAVHHVNNQPENIYRQLGAQLTDVDTASGNRFSGVRFAVFAPNASSVSVIGDFNHWDGRYHPMQKTNCGHWVLFVPDLKEGVRYKYELKDALGNRLPHKADPIGFHADQFPSHASIVFDHNTYQWNDAKWQSEQAKVDRYQTPMSVYELHLASWRKKQGERGHESLSYRELIDELIPYVKDMGYTHIEVLPVSEHPYDGSWGYQPVGMFAPTSRFGDPNDFKAFIDACHQADIGVIVDWVPAHFPEDSHGLARFDGTHMYEYDDPRRGWHQDWNSCIYDFGKDTVRQFLVSSALIWLERFHIDALRVDAVASMLYWDYSREEGEWIPNVDGGNENYEAISLLKWFNTEVYTKFPHAFTVAEESTAFPQVSRPVSDGGLGFGFKWNMGWMHDSLHYISKDPAYRKYHHNEITFSMVYSFNENFVLPISHDEVVHGKGSMMHKMPGDEWQSAANLRTYAGFMFAHPGKKLNFMGNEIGQTQEWNYNASLDWHLLAYDKHQGIQSTYRDLNTVYKRYPALYETDHNPQGFEWIEHQDAELSTLIFVRKAVSSAQKVYSVNNFTPVPREGFRMGVKDLGQYSVIFNSDEKQYWGSGFDVESVVQAEETEWQGQPYSIVINIPPLSSIMLINE